MFKSNPASSTLKAAESIHSTPYPEITVSVFIACWLINSDLSSRDQSMDRVFSCVGCKLQLSIILLYLRKIFKVHIHMNTKTC